VDIESGETRVLLLKQGQIEGEEIDQILHPHDKILNSWEEKRKDLFKCMASF
jgi:hypothetical protein